MQIEQWNHINEARFKCKSSFRSLVPPLIITLWMTHCCFGLTLATWWHVEFRSGMVHVHHFGGVYGHFISVSRLLASVYELTKIITISKPFPHHDNYFATTAPPLEFIYRRRHFTIKITFLFFFPTIYGDFWRIYSAKRYSIDRLITCRYLLAPMNDKTKKRDRLTD